MIASLARPLLPVLFAAADETESLRSLEFDWPVSPLGWSLYLGVPAAMLLFAVWMYRRDAVGLGWGWRLLLTSLRLAAIAGLLIVAFNPQFRTRQMSFRQSRVGVLVDTSLSMRFPESTPPLNASVADTPPVSRADAVEKLLGQSGLLPELRKLHDVRLYTFDSTLTGPLAIGGKGEKKPEDTKAEEKAAPRPVDLKQALRPQGAETRLGEAIVEAVRQLGGRTLSGVVIISDGNSNAGVEPMSALDAAKAGNARLMLVGVGGTEQPVNLQIASIQAPSDVHVGDPYEFSAFLQGYGLAGKSAIVELASRPEGDDKAKPTLIETREVPIREDGAPIEIKFRQTATAAGGIEYFVRAKPPAGIRELSTDDNVRRKTLNAIDRKLRVLLIASGPMRDYRFLHTMLNRHSAIEVDVWLQTVQPATVGQVSQDAKKLLVEFPKTPAELFDYDVVIGFDPDWSRLSNESRTLLMNWVGEHGGGLILVAGDIYTPQLASAKDELAKIKELYPVFLNATVSELADLRSEQPWPVGLTREGLEAGFLQLTENSSNTLEEWKRFSGIYRCYPTGGSKAAATVYAHFADPRTQNEHGQPILCAAQFYGSGRTMYLGSPELWRLRALDESYFDRFWTKSIREVGQGRLRRGAARGLLLLERNQYSLGQTIRVRANLLDPQLQPMTVDSVELDVFDPQGQLLETPRALTRDRDKSGQYWADFRGAMPGTYRIAVRPQPDDPRQNLSAKVDVVLPNIELDNPRQNVSLLTNLARETGGRYLRLERAAEELPALLPDRGERFAVDEQLQSLWDRQWVLYALVGLLATEWLIRKLLRLA